jgi:hypothetical protein
MKGTYYIIETAIAIFLVTSIFLLLFLSPPKNPEIERANVKNDIYRALETLNAKGSLRNQTLHNDATAIKNDLASFVPFNIQLNVAIYNKSFQSLTTEVSDQQSDIVGVSYYFAGDIGNYTPREIRVHGWGFD